MGGRYLPMGLPIVTRDCVFRPAGAHLLGNPAAFLRWKHSNCGFRPPRHPGRCDCDVMVAHDHLGSAEGAHDQRHRSTQSGDRGSLSGGPLRREVGQGLRAEKRCNNCDLLFAGEWPVIGGWYADSCCREEAVSLPALQVLYLWLRSPLLVLERLHQPRQQLLRC